MRADTTLRPPRPVRGVIVSTGEDVPQGQSLRARVLMVHVEKGARGQQGDVDWRELTRCQEDATRGLYAMALAGFIPWLAPRYGEVRQGVSALDCTNAARLIRKQPTGARRESSPI
jgi:hypothetical protein